MEPKTIVYGNQRTRTQRLRELGIAETILQQAVSDGFAARRNCTANHPSQTPGYYTWAETTRSLREQLVAEKWTRVEQGGISLIVNPSKDIAIAVTTGDEATGDGDLDASPRSKNIKGASAMSAVSNNQLMLPHISVIINAPQPTTTWKTYYLVVALVDGEGKSELSLPRSIGNDNKINAWIERIPLAKIIWNDHDPTVDIVHDMPDLDVPVTRIANAKI